MAKPVYNSTAQTLTSHKQEEIFRAFNGTTYVPSVMDVQTGALWDSISLSPGQTFTGPWATLFRDHIGTHSPTRKTAADTNMRQSGRLDAPEAFCIQRVVFTFSRDTSDKDMYAIAENCMWRFWLGQKRYLWAVLVSLPSVHQPTAPIRICTYCSGVYVMSMACPGCGAREFTLSTLPGEPVAGGRQFALDVNPHVVIGNQMNFYADFDGNPYIVEGPFKMWCHLEGLHARGTQ